MEGGVGVSLSESLALAEVSGYTMLLHYPIILCCSPCDCSRASGLCHCLYILSVVLCFYLPVAASINILGCLHPLTPRVKPWVIQSFLTFDNITKP